MSLKYFRMKPKIKYLFTRIFVVIYMMNHFVVIQMMNHKKMTLKILCCELIRNFVNTRVDVFIKSIK